MCVTGKIVKEGSTVGLYVTSQGQIEMNE